MALNAGFALIEFYLSLVAYFVLHMIFVISSDFVEAFNIPPLNIGIYVDKLAAIRALLMVLADLIEWRFLDKFLGDAGKSQYKLKEGYGKNGPRRIGSIVSFIVMLGCRLHYLWIVYFSDNKSLIAFITLCIEGFWFGVFQMSFFAIGPEFNAFTSFGIHTMGNFIFMLQVILQRRAKKKPKINSLYRVRVHAWIVVVTSIIAICLWIWFCYEYSLGGGDSEEFRELADELKGVSVTSTDQIDNIANELAKAFKDGTKFKELINKLKNDGGINSENSLTTSQLKNAITGSTGKTEVKDAISNLVLAMYGAEVAPGSNGKDITANEESNINNKLKVELTSSGSSNGIKPGTGEVPLEFKSNNANQGVKVTIKIDNSKTGSLKTKNDENNNAEAEEIARRLAKAANKAPSGGDSYKPGEELLKSKMEFGIEKATVTADTTNRKVNVNANPSGSGESGSAKIKITGGGEKFNKLVEELAKQVNQHLTKDLSDQKEIADKLKDALKGVKEQILQLIKTDFKLTSASEVTVEKHSSNHNVQVKIGGESATQEIGSATVSVKSTDITIKVMGNTSTPTNEQGQAIAILLVMALVHDKVKSNAGATLALPSNVKDEIEIVVNSSKSTAQANRIAFKLGKALEKVTRVRIGTNTPATLNLSLSQSSIPGETKNVWSPFWLFIVGAFAEDFSVPGILPFAFLDPDKANLVNYLTPSFFMTGALMTVLLNDFFEFKGFASSLGESRFKDWSEGAQLEWNAIWLFNLPKYIAFFIAMWSIHGTFDNLRCIIQSRWRVMLLTMTVVVPRAFLETAGYVGVANYAIFAADTNDFNGFDYIAYHDMLAMFCRFVYGKFAVGYNSKLK